MRSVIGAVRPSRRPRSLSSGRAMRGPVGGLLRMRRALLDAIIKSPHPEEARSAVSKDAQSKCSARSGTGKLMPITLSTRAPDFEAAFQRLLAAKRESAADVEAAVAAIIEDVARRGDAAL